MTQQEHAQTESISSYIQSTTCGGKDNPLVKSLIQIEFYNSIISSNRSSDTYIICDSFKSLSHGGLKDSSKTPFLGQIISLVGRRSVKHCNLKKNEC